MIHFVLCLIGFLGYFCALSVQLLLLFYNPPYPKCWVVLAILPAALTHALLLFPFACLFFSHAEPVLTHGVGFSVMASFVICCAVLLSLCLDWDPKKVNLTCLLSPISAFFLLPLGLPILCEPSLPPFDPYKVIHIVLAILTVSLIFLGTLQALFLSVYEYGLRRIQYGSLLHYFPPLERLEHGLFRYISIGFLSLTLLLSTSDFWMLIRGFSSLNQKNFLSWLIWLLFALLLLGRFMFGWRGRKVIAWTLSGFFLLTLVYVGSNFLIPALE